MTCPYCGNKCPAEARVCPECGQPLPAASPLEAPKTPREHVLRVVFLCACWAISLVVAGILFYKVYFWIDTYRINRLYLRGSRAPAVSEITMEDGRAGHAITFFADSGDQIFIRELGRSFPVSGGFARVELPDSTWFGSYDLTDVESAVVTLTPLLVRESGESTRLPALEFEVDAPLSPLRVISPEKDGIEVNTAIYSLQLQVVPGSTLLINGNDVSDMVDRRAGLLTYNLNVYPIGNNTISVLVHTPNHKETRRDIIIYRPEMEIALELSINTASQSATSTMTVSGICEPGATIEVDSPYVEESLTVNMETGEYKFLAQFSLIGDNTVSFRAVKEGKQDSVIRFNVYYLPTEADYTSKAWKMDYPQLLRLFEQWRGRIFLCQGMVIDVFEENGQQYVVMDVGTDGFQKLVVLVNYSSKTDLTPGISYSAYSDVQGRKMYNAIYCPLLNARYVYNMN